MCTKVFAFLFAVVFVSAAPEGATERVFNLTQTQTQQDVQEVVTVIRAIGGIRQVFLNSEHNSVVVRGTEDEIRLAEWVIAALDRPDAVPREFVMPGSTDERCRVFSLTNARTPRDLQEMAVLVRSIADAQRVFVYTRPKLLILRGNAWRISLAEWLINELNRPKDASPPAGPSEYRIQGGGDILPPDDVFVRVFYTHERTPEELQASLTKMRSALKVPRSFVNTARGAIIVRANAGNIAAAEQVLSGQGH